MPVSARDAAYFWWTCGFASNATTRAVGTSALSQPLNRAS